jgi:hypothetical protein
MDKAAYQLQLLDELGVTDNNFSITQPSSYLSYNSMFGLSYRYKLSKKFVLEPYFYFGMQAFTSPFTQVYYMQNGETYIYKKKTSLFYGATYTPGVQFQWNITNHIGLSLSAEYQGSILKNSREESLTYNYNSLEINNIEKNYKPQAISLMLGFSFSIGKGTKSE